MPTAQQQNQNAQSDRVREVRPAETTDGWLPGPSPDKTCAAGVRLFSSFGLTNSSLSRLNPYLVLSPSFLPQQQHILTFSFGQIPFPHID